MVVVEQSINSIYKSISFIVLKLIDKSILRKKKSVIVIVLISERKFILIFLFTQRMKNIYIYIYIYVLHIYIYIYISKPMMDEIKTSMIEWWIPLGYEGQW
jgi:hypothetical protein